MSALSNRNVVDGFGGAVGVKGCLEWFIRKMENEKRHYY